MVQHAVRTLELLAAEPVSGSRELARTLRIAPTSAYRILRTLQDCGWVERRDDSSYGPGNGLLRVARPLMGLAHGLARLRPQAEALGRLTGLTVVVSVREGDCAVAVDRVESARRAGVTVPLGARLPIIESFAGPCLLADAGQTALRRLVRESRPRNWQGQTEAEWRQRIADVRRKGWCLDPGVFHQRIAAISAAVRGPEGAVLAAISLLGLPGEFSLRAARRFRLPLLRAVQAAQATD